MRRWALWWLVDSADATGQGRTGQDRQGSGSWMCVRGCLPACACRCVLGDPRIPVAVGLRIGLDVDVVDVGVGECGLGDMDIGGWRADNRSG